MRVALVADAMRHLLPLLFAAGCGSSHHVPPAEHDPCDDDPTAMDCPCTDESELPCYEGPSGSSGVGVCVGGLRDCISGSWGACDGQMIPAEESCNGLDDDCDGVVDEDVVSECGDCDAGCSIVGYGPAEDLAFDDASATSDGTIVGADGRLATGGSLAPRDVLYAPAQGDTVARVDTLAREVVGEYLVSWAVSNVRPNEAAVDYAGNAYVGNEGRPSQTSLTKILYECVDGDRDGTIETSAGAGDVLDFGDDECVAWRAFVDCEDLAGCDQATSVSYEMRVESGAIAERIWLGLSGNELREIDAETGEDTGVVARCGARCNPSGAAIDRDGVLWTDCWDRVCRFETRDPDNVEEYPRAELSSQDLTLDPSGNVWTAGYVATFETASEDWTLFDSYFGHGVSAAANGDVYVGACPEGDASGSFCRIDPATFDVEVIPGNLRILAVDSRGLVWGFQGGTSVYDPATGIVEPALDCGSDPCVFGPWAGSDMTGTQLMQSTDAPGTWRAVVPGCAAGQATTWVGLEWDAEIPDGAAIRFDARAANDADALAARAWTTIANAPRDGAPADLQGALDVDRTARMLEVKATLAKEPGAVAATVGAVRVQRRCE